MESTKPEPTTDNKSDDLPTIWRIPDSLWELLQKVLAVYDPPKKTGRPRMDPRQVLDGIVYRARTGCQWNQLPKEFGDDASIHRTLQRWEALGLFDILWAVLLSKAQELGGVDWQWQAADGCLGKARGVPKKGHKRSASAPIRPIVANKGSRRVCSSSEAAALLVL